MATQYAEHYGKTELDITTGGALTDYSAGLTQISGADFSVNAGTHFTPGAINQVVTVGGIMHSDISITVKVDPTSGSLYRVLKAWEAEILGGTNSTRTFRRSTPDSSTSGAQQVSGEAFLTGLGHGSNVGGSGNVNTVTATLKPTGAMTVATVT